MIIKEQMQLLDDLGRLNILINDKVDNKSIEAIVYIYISIIFYVSGEKDILDVSKKISMLLVKKAFKYKKINIKNLFNQQIKKDKNLFGMLNLFDSFSDEHTFYFDPKQYLSELVFVNKKLVKNLLSLLKNIENYTRFKKLIGFNEDKVLFLLLFNGLKNLLKKDTVILYDFLRLKNPDLFEIFCGYSKITSNKLFDYCIKNNPKAKNFLITYLCEKSNNNKLAKNVNFNFLHKIFTETNLCDLGISIEDDSILFNQHDNHNVVKFSHL